MSYLKTAATPRKTSQREPIPGSDQVKNSAGGFVWEIGTMQRLRRWLVLGSADGTYYASEQKLTRENVKAVREALDEHGPAAVEEIVVISTSGRAPKPDQAIYALAMACAHPDKDTRYSALESIPKVCRTGTHLFMFVDFVQDQRGWGRALERAVAAWYEREDTDKLAYQLVKYRQRNGWTHRDVLRLSHPEAFTPQHAQLFDWVCGRDVHPESEYVKAFLSAQKSQTPLETTALIDLYGGALPREALLTEHLADPNVNEALLLQGMPMTALTRNLGNLTRIGTLRPMGATTKLVSDQLENAEALSKARVHPMNVLMALATYASGHGFRGTNSWAPIREIVDALDAAFYKSFDNVEPTGKRYVLGLDCSHSMNQPLSGCPMMTCMQGAAAMALITERTESRNVCVAFHGHIVPVPLSSRQRLDDVSLPRSVGRTDCSLPILWALGNKIEADVFVLYSDNETWYGDTHPAQALKAYREKMGIDARLVVCAMTATPFSIADPNDAGMLDVVGFDSATPQIIAEFAAGNI